MKIFYSELTANPAYYSFGYSVYGVLEEGDSLDEVYEKGFLPFVGAREQDERMVYQARGTRVRLAEFSPHHYHTRIVRKAQEVLGGVIETRVIPKDAVENVEEVLAFFETYFTKRFGKGAVPMDRLRALWACPFLTHLAEYTHNGAVVAYGLEVHGKDFVHIWYQAYAARYTGAHVGASLYLELITRAQTAGKQYLYFGVTYGSWMKYKTNFQPLEYWDGREWVHDPKSVKLKRLFSRDSTRMLGFVDEWRSAHDPFYPAPAAFTSPFDELRFLPLLAAAAPRFIGFLMLIAAGLLALVWVLVFVL